MIAGVASAATVPDVPTEGAFSITVQQSGADADKGYVAPGDNLSGIAIKDGKLDASKLKDQNVLTVISNGSTKQPYNTFINTSGLAGLGEDASYTFDKELWVVVNGAHKDAEQKPAADTSANGSRAHGLYASGVDAVNAGKIYVKADDNALALVSTAIVADNGATATNKGLVAVENGVGMKVGTTGVNTVINAKSGQIVATGKARGFELEGDPREATQETAPAHVGTNYGSVTVEGKEAFGAWVNGKNSTFTNAGVIDGTKGAAAIALWQGTVNLDAASVTKGAVKVAGGTLNAKANSAVEGTVTLTGGEFNAEGNITVAEGGAILVEGVKPTFNKEQDKFDNVVENSATVNLKKGSVTTGDVVVKDVTVTATKQDGTTTVTATSKVTANINLDADAVVTGNLDLSGTQHNVAGATDDKFATVGGKILANAGATALTGNFKAQALNVAAGATASTAGHVVVDSVDVAAEVKEGETVKKVAANLAVNSKLDVNDALTNHGSLNVGADGVVTVAGDSLNKGEINQFDGSSPLTGKLVIKGGTFANDGKMTLKDIVVGSGATLKTGVNLDGKASYMVFDELTLENGSTLNLAALNSKVKDTDTANNELKFNRGTLNLNGGSVLVADKAFNGVLHVDGDAQVNVRGSYELDTLNVTGTATVTVGENLPVVTLKTLETATGTTVAVDEGNLTVTDAFKNAEGTVQVHSDGVLTLTTKATGLKIAEGAYTSKAVENNGTVVLTDAAGEFATLEAVSTLKNKIVASGNGLVKFGDKVTVKADKVAEVIKDNTITATTAEKLNGVELQQFAHVTVGGVTETGLTGGSFGNVKLAADAPKEGAPAPLKVTAGLTLNNGGDLVQTKDGKLAGVELGQNASLTTTGVGAVLGAVVGTTGTLKVAAGDLTVKGNINVDDLTVADQTSLTLDKATATDKAVGTVTVADGFDVFGTLTAGDVNVTDEDAESWVLGTMTANKLTLQGELFVGSDAEAYNKAGKVIVSELLGDGTVFVDPAWKDGNKLTLGEASQVAIGSVAGTATVIAGQGSVVALGTTDVDAALKAVAAAGHAELGANEGQVKSALYVEGGKAYDDVTGAFTYKAVDGTIAATGWTEADYEVGTVTASKVKVDADNLMVVNMDTIDTKGVNAVFTNGVINEGTIYLASADLGDKINFSADKTGYTQGEKGEILFNGDRLMSAVADKVEKDLFTIGWDKEKVADYQGLTTLGLVQAMYEQGAQNGASTSVKFNDWLMSSTNGLTATQVIEAGNDVAAIGATAGMASVTMDAMSAFNDTVGARTSILMPRAQQTTVWADVTGGRYEGKKVFDGAGYSADIFAGVIGVDTQVGCGAVLGAALTVGQADTDSENTSAKTSMDSDFFGLSVYTSKTFGDIWNVAADFGYMQGSNDVDVKAYNLGKFSADTDAFTFGLRGEVLTKAGAFNIVPHAGLRWTRISTDSFEAGYTTDIDSMNVFQMPVGVTVAGNVAMGDWAVAPSFDLSFVPAFGDKDAEMTLGIAGVKASDDLAVRVIDSNPVQATLGVDASNGNWGFGLNYKLGVGSDDRMNNAFSANVRYAF